jgi:hypothetical protein
MAPTCLRARPWTVAAEIAAVARHTERTVRRWLVRYQPEALAGPADVVVRMRAPWVVQTALLSNRFALTT